MTMQEEQKLRAVYDSASDEQLENVLVNKKDYRPEVVDIVAGIIKNRSEKPKELPKTTPLINNLQQMEKIKQHKMLNPSVKIQNTSVGDYKEVGFTIYLIRTCYSWIFAIMFWLFIIVSIVSGAKIAMWFTDNKSVETSVIVLGGLFGLVGGFIVAVWANGIVAAILNLDANIQYLADKEKAKGDK